MGQVVPRDLDRAIAIFRRVCEKGAMEVCIGLGELYEKEKSDNVTAAQWFHRACAGGSPSGCEAEKRVTHP